MITRNPYELVLLSPGASQSNAKDGGFNINGSRDRNNNFLLDGVDNNDTSSSRDRGRRNKFQSRRLGPGIPRNNQQIYNAEYGRNTGAIIDVVTKGGTNYASSRRLLGSAGTTKSVARVTGSIPRPDPNGQLRRISNVAQPVWLLREGGPIRKDKTFFFVYQGSNVFRLRSPRSQRSPPRSS